MTLFGFWNVSAKTSDKKIFLPNKYFLQGQGYTGCTWEAHGINYIPVKKSCCSTQKSFNESQKQPNKKGGGVEGRGQSTRSYFKISTLCRRLRSCIPLDLHVTSDYFLVSGTQKAERCQPYDIQIQEILEAMAHNK